MPATQAAISKDVSQKAGGLRRYVALDAYRGFIMLLLASEGFGFAALKNDPAWGRVASWFDHVPWEGAVFWDMIQPAFMFMVGVAMPFAMARRIENGSSWSDNLRHVITRSVSLIILSQILMSVSCGHITPQLINVLSQIAFTYFLSFLIMRWKWSYQVLAAAGLLAFWTALLFAFPGPDGPFSKTNSVGLVVDRAIFHYDYDPAYSTLNFIPSTVWTLSGVWVGRLLMTTRSHAENLRVLAAGMAVGFVVGLALRPWIPMIKQLCTPSFILYSLGWGPIHVHWLLLADRSARLAAGGVPACRSRNEFDFHLLDLGVVTWMVGSRSRCIHVSLQLFRHVCTDRPIDSRIAGHVVSLLLALQAKDFYQAVNLL